MRVMCWWIGVSVYVGVCWWMGVSVWVDGWMGVSV